jgi:hypothetical protein
MSAKQCQACGAAITREPPIPRDAECEGCGADLRCCRNCRHFDVHVNNQCRETEAELVTDKTRRNFCEYFEITGKPFAAATGTPAKDRAAEARAKLDALFRKK